MLDPKKGSFCFPFILLCFPFAFFDARIAGDGVEVATDDNGNVSGGGSGGCGFKGNWQLRGISHNINYANLTISFQ